MEERSWVAVCFFLSLISALLQIAAYVSPMWLWVVDGAFYLGIGLWYYTGCGADCTFTTTSDPQFSTDSNVYFGEVYFNVVRGFETAAVISVVLLCIFLLILLIGWRTWRNMHLVRASAIIMAIVSCLSMVTGLAVFLAKYYNILYYSPQIFNSASFPWSLLLTFLALLLSLLVTIFIFCCTRSPDGDPGIPLSGDSKMALTPTVTNGNNGKKYYVPSPYTDDRRTASYMDDDYSRKSFVNDNGDKFLSPNGYGNGYHNKGYMSDYNESPYSPTGYRPRSYAEPSRTRDEISYRSAPQHNYRSLDRDGYRESRYVDREPRYADKEEPVYSHYVERPRPPAGARSVLPPVVPQDLSRSKYTDEVKLGASTSYMYRPYAPQRY